MNKEVKREVKKWTNKLKTCQNDDIRSMCLFNRGKAYCSTLLGKNKEAIRDFTKAIEIHKNYHEAYYYRAIVHSKLGKTKKALLDYTKAIEVNKDYRVAYFNRGMIHSDLGENEEAIRDFTRAIEIDKDIYFPYCSRGCCYLNLGKIEEAKSDFETVLDIFWKRVHVKLVTLSEKEKKSRTGIKLLLKEISEVSDEKNKKPNVLTANPLFQFLKEGKLEKYFDVLKDEGWGLDDLEFVDSDEDIPEGVKSKVHRKKMLKYILDWKEKKKKKEVEEREGRNWIKIAFVVGVSNYSKFKDPLKGSKVDAEDVRKALKKNGFYVFSAMDMDGGDEEDCLEDDLLDSFDEFVKFRRKYWKKTRLNLRDKLFTLFYFAGHGLFPGTSQCLIPEDFDEEKLLRKALKITKQSKESLILKAQKGILQNTLLVTTVINALSDEGKLVLLLDCCRNDVKFNFELEPKKKRSGSGKKESSDIIVSYSTKIGDKAKDLPLIGRNSPYTRALLKNFEKGKGEKIEDILKAVREDVLVETKDNQEPVFEDKQLKNSVFTW